LFSELEEQTFSIELAIMPATLLEEQSASVTASQVAVVAPDLF
jgi:hypothetical protein